MCHHQGDLSVQYPMQAFLQTKACMNLQHVHTIQSTLHLLLVHMEMDQLICVFFIAAASFSVTTFLKKHEDDFFKYVNPRQSLLRLKRKGVITEDVKSSTDGSNAKDALEILYDHLTCHGNLHTLREYCKMAIDAEGFPNMQALGRKMMMELPTEVGIVYTESVRPISRGSSLVL